MNLPVSTSLWTRTSPRAVEGVRRPPEWASGGREGLMLGFELDPLREDDEEESEGEEGTSMLSAHSDIITVVYSLG
jgi:hypothetical protein